MLKCKGKKSFSDALSSLQKVILFGDIPQTLSFKTDKHDPDVTRSYPTKYTLKAEPSQGFFIIYSKTLRCLILNTKVINLTNYKVTIMNVLISLSLFMFIAILEIE